MTKIRNVKNITKFRRSVKAISPVIATLLMIAIAVVASLVVYAWVSGYIGFQTGKAGESIALPSFAGVASQTDPNVGDLVVYVQNVGQGTIEISAVYVDDELRTDWQPDPSATIDEGNTVQVTITGPFDLTVKHDIKVTTTSGTFMTTTGKPATSTNEQPPTNAEPTAAFSWEATELVVDFTDASTDSDGTIATRAWDFGDTQTSTETNPTITYAAAGTYTVSLTVTDDDGATDTVTHDVTISENLIALIDPTGTLTMDAGQTQTFLCSASGGTGAKSYQWYLDGSAVLDETETSYEYTAATSGSPHRVYCMVTDSASVSDNSDTVSITVNSAMSALTITPSTTPITMTAGSTQTFTHNTVTGGSGTKSYQWYLDGAAVSGQTGTTYTYTAQTAGSPHTVYCRVTDSATTPVTLQSNTVTINVNAAPTRQTIFSDDVESWSWDAEWIESGRAYADITNDESHSSSRSIHLDGRTGNDGYVTLQISTTGYTSIQLSYWRDLDRAGGYDSNGDNYIIEWRVGTSVAFTPLETINSDISWGQSATLPLSGADNQGTIQIRFRLENCENGDEAYLDDILVTGLA